MKKGQILLITVMLLATVMTIVLSVSFKSVTDTQVTKLEEESQKALAAAESAIEVALKDNATATIGSGSLTSITGFSGSATIESLAETTFITSTISKDGGYTFYLGNYNLATKTIDTPYFNRNILLCFKSGSAVEATLVKSNGVVKYLGDSTGTIIGAPTGTCNGNVTYTKSIDIPADPNGQFLLVRVLYASTKLFFSSNGINLPIQGRTVSSQATSSTSTGVSKKVVLFQSYPQIPDEFFTTAF